MHMLSDVGIIKTTPEIFQQLKNKLWIKPANTTDFYLVDLSRKSNKKILANNGVSFVLSVWTDYFGGCGEQGAKLFHLTTNFRERQRAKRFSSINKGLLELGFDMENHLLENTDPYDSIGLSNYREYEDFAEHFKKVKNDSTNDSIENKPFTDEFFKIGW